MAYTVTNVKKTVFGDTRIHILKVSADAATQSIDTGLDYVYSWALGPSSMATSAISIFENVGAEATAMAGYLGVSAAANNDVFFLTVYGK